MSKETTDSTVVVRPARNIAGALRLPGDKSISHRYAMLAAIAEGTTRLENFSTGADCASTLSCLAALGVELERKENGVLIHGRGPKLQPPKSSARLRQLGINHAHVERHSGRTRVHQRAHGRRIAVAASDGANHRASSFDGREDCGQ